MKKIYSSLFSAIFAGAVFCSTLYAMDFNGLYENIEWGPVLIGLFGGLVFFLYGMEIMSEGLKKSAGSKMRLIIAGLTKSRIRGLFVGAFVTMVIQSSSATTVMLVSFVQSGLMSFYQTLGVILGSGIGCTMIAHLIAFKVTDYALLMIAAGFVLKLVAKTEKAKNTSQILLGFGILFYGMKLMSDSMSPLRTNTEFIDLMKGLENPYLGLLVGTVFTALIQSSGAFVGIMIVLAQQGLITLDASIPMVFGSNIGTCITAVLVSIGTSREAKRVAFSHVFFKIVGTLLFFPWLTEFSEFILMISKYVSSGIGRDIANVHTLFNVAIGILFLPITDLFARIAMRVIPDREDEEGFKPMTTYLDDSQIVYPSLAIDLARSEISRMADILEQMLRAAAVPFATNEPKQDKKFPQYSLIEGIELREKEIDYLEVMIEDYLLKILRHGASNEENCTIYSMVSIVKDMESIGDIVHRNVLPLIPKKQELEHDFSEEGKEELTIYHQKVCKQVRLLKEAFAERNLDKARRIMEKERKYLDMRSQYRIQHLNRLITERKESVDTHQVHTELMNFMTQIIVYTSNIAKTYLGSCQFK